MAHYQSLLDEKAKLTVTAPVAGKIVDLTEGLRVGMWYPAKAPLVAVIDTESVTIDAYVFEADLGRVSSGDNVSFFPAGEPLPKLPGE